MNRTLGFDLGSKTLGVSVSDPLGMIARALTTLRFDSDDYDSALAQAQALIREQHADKVVLGLPRHMNGDIGVRGAISDVGVGLELCRAAMRSARLNILINASGMSDEVFAMTLRRECELVFEQYGPVIDAGLKAVEERIG